jgi:hypothetical protein
LALTEVNQAILFHRQPCSTTRTEAKLGALGMLMADAAANFICPLKN